MTKQRTRERPFGTVYEPDTQFVSSDNRVVHKREPTGDSVELDWQPDPKCGTSVSGLWSGFHGIESVDEIIERHYMHRFCSKCFENSYGLNQEIREKRDEERGL